MTKRTQLSDAELNAYLDGELTGSETRSVEEWLAAHPEDARRAASLRRTDEAIRAGFGKVIEEPLPRSMTALLDRGGQRPVWIRAMRAAAVLLVFLGGGTAGYFWRDAQVARIETASNFVGSAIGAHQVFAVEVRHPVEVGADQEEHLVRWLTKRLGADFHAPRLAPHGFELVGGRLLPAAGGEPAAQFMYQDKSGRRLTLYLRTSAQGENTAIQIANAGKISALYWIDKPLACAIIAELPREQLMEIAHTIYSQLD